jgi:hypothetical protein
MAARPRPWPTSRTEYYLAATRPEDDRVIGFARLGLHRVSAAIGPDSSASIAVVKRLGFTHEGRLRDHVFTNGAGGTASCTPCSLLNGRGART